ncbi:MAG TPA: hypothetical protein VFQ53_15585 [Kofleriaceae bacterium]|nr:hypothetical protein [Kofleriaceae bacterium]
MVRLLFVLALVACGKSSDEPARPPAPPARDAALAPDASRPVAWHSCLLDGKSPCVSATPVRVGSELIAWSDWLAAYARDHASEHPLGVTECRWIAELDRVLLCGSNSQQTMNPPLLRPSMFVEHRPGIVVALDDPQYEDLLHRIAGFDLTKQDPARPDLVDFYTALDRACAKDRAMCATAAEQAMRSLLESVWTDKPDMVLLTFATGGAIAESAVVSHEILHAQYFTDPVYRQVIDDYWKQLPRAKRQAVIDTLSPPYNGDDDLLMRNELQAYALMSVRDTTRLGKLRGIHRDPLLRLLADRGRAPIVVEERAPSQDPWAR